MLKSTFIVPPSIACMVEVVFNSRYDDVVVVVESLCLNGTHAAKIGQGSAQG